MLSYFIKQLQKTGAFLFFLSFSFPFVFVLLFFLSSPYITCAASFSPRAEETENPPASAPYVFQSEAPYALLMEASTGQILYEKEADTEKPPASVTKIMTLLLIMEALDQKQLSLSDTVTVSEHAASMGGSQVFLEVGETQSVDTMIKCIAVSSANDACVAMAEHIAGSEDAFVGQMNQKASSLGMNHTHFINCCGLDADGHYTCARDIALMSRELTTKYPEIFQYTTIWMEDITHVTQKGASQFGLSNTNKLIRHYEGATGLKTGSTSKAGFCLSATATRNAISLIAVVMNCPSSTDRNRAASGLLDYGFSVCRIYRDEAPPAPTPIPIKGGTRETLSYHYKNTFSYISTTELNPEKIEKKTVIRENLSAPIAKEEVIGELIYAYEGKKIGAVPLLCDDTIEKARYFDRFRQLITAL